MSEPALTATVGGTPLLAPLLAQWEADYTDGGRDRPTKYLPFPGKAAPAVAEFHDAANRWRAAIAGADAMQATEVGHSSWPIGMDRDLPFVDIVWWMNRELIHHGADIATVRDLYSARS